MKNRYTRPQGETPQQVAVFFIGCLATLIFVLNTI